MAHVEVEPGVRLFVQEWGAGPPVVFIHGGGMTHAFWDHQVAALIDSFHTVTFDLRGCGASDRPRGEYSVDVWVRDVRALVERLELDRPIVVGHAIGSHVAMRFAVQHPEMLSKLVLASSAPWATGERGQAAGFSEAFWQDLQARLLSNHPQAELDLADERYFHKSPGEGMRLWALSMALQWPLPVYMGIFESFPSVDHREYLADVELPTLILHGRHDEKNRYDGGCYLAEQMPNAQLVTFEDSAHCPPLEEIERFNQALREFFVAQSSTPAVASSAR
jgi:non-heme chloroperoxidase